MLVPGAACALVGCAMVITIKLVSAMAANLAKVGRDWVMLPV